MKIVQFSIRHIAAQVFWMFSVLTLVCLFSQSRLARAAGAPEGGRCALLISNLNPGSSNFGIVDVGRLIWKRYDLSRLEAEVNFSDSDPGRMYIGLSYKGREVRHVDSTQARSNEDLAKKIGHEKFAMIELIEIDERFRGRGFGLFLYFAISRKLAQKGYLLTKSYDTTADADAMWARFVRRRNAIRVRLNRDENYIVMDPKFVMNAELWQNFDNYFTGIMRPQ